MKYLTYCSVLLILLVGLFSGCSSAPASDDLTGTWQNEVQADGKTKYYDLILGNDNTFIAYETYQNTPTDENSEPESSVLGIGNGSFTYEDNKLNLTYKEVNVEEAEYTGSAREVATEQLNKTFTYDVSLNGNQLTLTNGDKKITFERQS